MELSLCSVPSSSTILFVALIVDCASLLFSSSMIFTAFLAFLAATSKPLISSASRPSMPSLLLVLLSGEVSFFNISSILATVALSTSTSCGGNRLLAIEPLILALTSSNLLMDAETWSVPNFASCKD